MWEFGFSQVFCDKGAERKARDEERRATKRRMTTTGISNKDMPFFSACAHHLVSPPKKTCKGGGGEVPLLHDSLLNFQPAQVKLSTAGLKRAKQQQPPFPTRIIRALFHFKSRRFLFFQASDAWTRCTTRRRSGQTSTPWPTWCGSRCSSPRRETRTRPQWTSAPSCHRSTPPGMKGFLVVFNIFYGKNYKIEENIKS